MKFTSLLSMWCFKKMRVKVSDIKEKADVFLKLFLFRKRLCFWWFLKIPQRLLPQLFKIKSSERASLFYIKIPNFIIPFFFFPFGKCILSIFLFQSNGVSCAFISLQCLLDYSSPGVGCRKQRLKALVICLQFLNSLLGCMFCLSKCGFLKAHLVI